MATKKAAKKAPRTFEEWAEIFPAGITSMQVSEDEGETIDRIAEHLYLTPELVREILVKHESGDTG